MISEDEGYKSKKGQEEPKPEKKERRESARIQTYREDDAGRINIDQRNSL